MAQFTLSLKDKARCGYSPATVAGGEKQQARLWKLPFPAVRWD